MKRVNSYSDSDPSLTPNDLHFTLDPPTQIMVARKTANDNLACTQPITRLYGLSHLKDNLSAILCRKNPALVPSMPSTEKHRGVKLAGRAKQAAEYFFFFQP